MKWGIALAVLLVGIGWLGTPTPVWADHPVPTLTNVRENCEGVGATSSSAGADFLDLLVASSDFAGGFSGFLAFFGADAAPGPVADLFVPLELEHGTTVNFDYGAFASGESAVFTPLQSFTCFRSQHSYLPFQVLASGPGLNMVKVRANDDGPAVVTDWNTSVDFEGNVVHEPGHGQVLVPNGTMNFLRLCRGTPDGDMVARTGEYLVFPGGVITPGGELVSQDPPTAVQVDIDDLEWVSAGEFGCDGWG